MDFASLIELSSVALGGTVISCSDEFFAPAKNLLSVHPSISMKGQFGPNGALYDGWETRRHNPASDWVIIRLGASGFIEGLDIDTSHFAGNEASAASVHAAFLTSDEQPPTSDDSRWTEILPKTPLGPNSRHLFKLEPNDTPYNFLKLTIYPDGGVARFRAFGIVNASIDSKSALTDLASVYSGARVVQVSDQHYGVGSNLLLPGRGHDMSDGWETKRSRTPDHKDYVIIKLGFPGCLDYAEIDTANFIGNYPESCELHGIHSNKFLPSAEDAWIPVLKRTKLGPHRRHSFQLENIVNQLYSHIRLTIYPDGGVKRLRIFGRLDPAAPGTAERPIAEAPIDAARADITTTAPAPKGPTFTALSLTPEAFAPFGQVIQGWDSQHFAPKGVKVTHANQGTALKFHKLAPVESNYPGGNEATTNLSVYRSSVIQGAAPGSVFPVHLLERHPFTNQAFIPMGCSDIGDDSLAKAARAFLVIVAPNGVDDKPDLSSLRAFVASTAQGVVYGSGVWHHPIIPLETTIDFTCVETQIGNGSSMDCEIVEFKDATRVARISIPSI